MANQYDLGDLVRCTGVFTDSDGNAQDPTTVYFKIRNPAGTITSYIFDVDGELVKSATGTYYVDIDCDEVGQWWYRFHSTGTGQAAGENAFAIIETQF